jgi:hypothetical protein
MSGNMLRSAAFLLASTSALASAQMAVHAVTGPVKAVSPHNLSVAVDSDSISRFKIAPSTKVPVEFSHDLRSSCTAPESFQKVGDFALVYYTGYGDDQTVVAVKDLGAGPFLKVKGTVVEFDKHSRTLTLKDDAGKQLSMLLNDEMVVDTDRGVDSGRKFTPHKGDQIRATYVAGTPATVAFLGEFK